MCSLTETSVVQWVIYGLPDRWLFSYEKVIEIVHRNFLRMRIYTEVLKCHLCFYNK
uniref:Uncharacterized protein n=1 Tax=Anguilla anguilla TaxID=7936 RepID=A0A0E9VD45_ANGAN